MAFYTPTNWKVLIVKTWDKSFKLEQVPHECFLWSCAYHEAHWCTKKIHWFITVVNLSTSSIPTWSIPTWPNGNWQNRNWQSGKLTKWELTKWELAKWELTKWEDTCSYSGLGKVTFNYTHGGHENWFHDSQSGGFVTVLYNYHHSTIKLSRHLCCYECAAWAQMLLRHDYST